MNKTTWNVYLTHYIYIFLADFPLIVPIRNLHNLRACQPQDRRFSDLVVVGTSNLMIVRMAAEPAHK